MPIALSDDQLSVVMQHAEPLPPADRGRYLERVAQLLRQPVGDGAVNRACRAAFAEIFRPPQVSPSHSAPRL